MKTSLVILPLLLCYNSESHHINSLKRGHLLKAKDEDTKHFKEALKLKEAPGLRDDSALDDEFDDTESDSLVGSPSHPEDVTPPILPDKTLDNKDGLSSSDEISGRISDVNGMLPADDTATIHNNSICNENLSEYENSLKDTKSTSMPKSLNRKGNCKEGGTLMAEKLKSDMEVDVDGDFDDFKVYYPPKYKENKKNSDETRAYSYGEYRQPLLLGSLVHGLNGETNPGIELYPGALSNVYNSISSYFKDTLDDIRKTMAIYFKAIDENLKHNNGLPIIEYGDVLF